MHCRACDVMGRQVGDVRSLQSSHLYVQYLSEFPGHQLKAIPPTSPPSLPHPRPRPAHSPTLSLPGKRGQENFNLFQYFPTSRRRGRGGVGWGGWRGVGGGWTEGTRGRGLSSGRKILRVYQRNMNRKFSRLVLSSFDPHKCFRILLQLGRHN
jgi:hypothetical protein